MFTKMLKMLVVTACVIKLARSQEGAEYLQNTIRDLTNHMEQPLQGPTNRRNSDIQVVTPVPKTPIKRVQNRDTVPTLHLTKAELAAMYESAVNKGETIKLDANGKHGDAKQHINAAVHELGGSPSNSVHQTAKYNDHEKDPGYYYYYYPLKSFMDELTSSTFTHNTVSDDDHHQHDEDKYHQHDEDKYHQHHEDKYHQHHEDKYHHYHEEPSTVKPHQYAHTHQHNVHIEPIKNMMDMDKKSKALEPLFMAISGFIGMTIMFILSILVLPKFKKMKPKGFKENSELTSISKIALQAIEGHNCAERIACEAGKAARAFNLYNNRFVKLIRRMAPKRVVKHIDKIGKYTDIKLKCGVIKCNYKDINTKQAKIIKRKPKILT